MKLTPPIPGPGTDRAAARLIKHRTIWAMTPIIDEQDKRAAKRRAAKRRASR